MLIPWHYNSKSLVDSLFGFILQFIVHIIIKHTMLRRLFELLLSCLALASLTQQAGVNWNRHDDIRTGQQVMFTSSSSFFRSIDTPISYFVVYSNVISSTRSAGVGIVGFKSVLGTDWSMNTTVENFTTYSLRLTVRVYNDTALSFYSVNWIAVGNLVDFAQVLFNCHLCTNLKVGRGDRLQSRTGVTLFSGYTQLFVNVYLAGFSLHNSDGITNYLKASAAILSNTTTINYQFFTNQNNTISQLCYTTIIFNEIITKNLYYNWGTTGSKTLSNKASETPAAFVFPASISYQARDRMFFGLSAFNISRASQRNFYFNTSAYGTLTQNYTTNEGTYAVEMDFFWLAVRSCNASDPWFNVINITCENDCDNPSFSPTIYETTPGDYCNTCHYTCQNCSEANIDSCTTCEEAYFRKLASGPPGRCECNSSYIDKGGDPLCYPCENFIPGCDTCVSPYLCLTCLPGFAIQPSGICQCTAGFLVSGVCTSIVGCTNLVEYGGTVYCTSCNSTLYFQTTVNYTCECMAGYYLVNNQICRAMCGDARQTASQGCDDGNMVAGDGCSDTCFTELNWVCLGGSPTTPSVCYISDPSLQMVVKYVRRVTSMNRMQVGIRILPTYSQLTLANFKQYIKHNVPCTNYNATYINGQLLLEFDYNTSIQGLSYNLNLTLDPNVFYNTTLNVQIPASGMNAKLTYDSANSVNYPFEIIVIVLDVLAIIIMFASCISERMIGIEMIQTLQTVLYTQAVMKTTPSSLSPLQMLRYASGYNEIQGIDYDRTYTFAFSLSSLGLEKEFLLSYNLMYIILMAVIILCCILKAKQYYHQNKMGKFVRSEEQLKNQQKFQKVTKIYNFVFERILFLVGFMCMFLVVFALMLQLTDMSSDYTVMSKQFNLLGSIVAIAIISTLLCAVILNGCFPGTLIFPMLMKQYYPPIYFIYQSAFIFVLAFDYTQEYVLYILGGMSLVFMVYNMIHRPYPQKFHTFVLIFHQLVIVGVIGVYVFQNLTKPTQHETLYKILNGVVVALLYIVVGLNGYRLYRYYMFVKNNGWDQYGNEANLSQNHEDEVKYRQLNTPKNLDSPRKDLIKNYGTNDPDKAPKKGKRDEGIQLEQIRRPAKDNNKTRPVQDQSAMNWKYNKLADEDTGNGRFQATNRDAKPDTNRDRPLVRTKTNEKLGNNNNNDVSFSKNKDQGHFDEENTIKDLDTQNKLNKGRDDTGNNNEYNSQNDNENVFDNPYDENGYAKKTGSSPKQAEIDDPLQAIKRRLKQDFNSKIKTSTIKQ